MYVAGASGRLSWRPPSAESIDAAHSVNFTLLGGIWDSEISVGSFVKLKSLPSDVDVLFLVAIPVRLGNQQNGCT